MANEQEHTKEYVVESIDCYAGYVRDSLIDGKGQLTGRSRDSYLEEGYYVLSEEEFKQLHKEWESKPYESSWREISEDEYDNFLNVMPPVKWTNGGFFLSEATHGDIHPFFQEWGGKFYRAEIDITLSREEILNDLKAYIKDAAKELPENNIEP